MEAENSPFNIHQESETGPFDIVGDIHGCYQELMELMHLLGYEIKTIPYDEVHFGYRITHPENNKLVSVGDLIDRGPSTVTVLKIFMSMMEDQTAFCVLGNHDLKLLKKLNGKNVKLLHGLEKTMQEIEDAGESFKEKVRLFLERLPAHIILDHGKLVIAHAGIKEDMFGEKNKRVDSFCYFGDTNGKYDEFGLPIRRNWGAQYTGDATIVFGHTPVLEPVWQNNTIDIDTGCVFGGRLTALKYPEKDKFISVEHKKKYAIPARPIKNIC